MASIISLVEVYNRCVLGGFFDFKGPVSVAVVKGPFGKLGAKINSAVRGHAPCIVPMQSVRALPFVVPKGSPSG